MDLDPSSISHVVSSIPHIITHEWNRFTAAYPGYLERFLIIAGTLYSLSIVWVVLKVVFAVGSKSIRWWFAQVDQFLGWSPEPIFEDQGSNCEGVLENELYGLEHMALNWTWEGGLQSMWMNMGYWKVRTCMHAIIA